VAGPEERHVQSFRAPARDLCQLPSRRPQSRDAFHRHPSHHNLFQAFIGPMFIMAELLMALGLKQDLKASIDGRP
jgi:hypothetical protein